MWQLLLAAAVTGSSILAKKLLTPDSNNPISHQENEGKCNLYQEKEEKCDIYQPQTFQENVFHHQDSIFISNGCILDNGYEVGQSVATHDGSFFRFSSIDHETEMGGFSNNNKRFGSCSKGVKGKIGVFKKKGSEKVKKKCGFVVGGGGGGQDGVVVDQRKSGIGRKLGSVCLKKRRTSKCASGKCESCSSKESSLFNWGLGVGIMYMMSAGKVEVNRLNSAMDETAKAVQELKAELLRRKTLLNMHSSSSEAEGGCSANNSREQLINSVSNTDPKNVQSFDPYDKFGDACMSDNLMQEQPEVMDMNQLEAEFVSELEKLPYCTTEGSGSEGGPDSYQLSGFSAKDYNGNSGPFNGVSPTVLDQKLSQLLMEQQENHIVELESELQKSNSKLNEKEAELQALKECVRRLTEFSLASISVLLFSR
ncbi:hypothetical protein Leryth_009892 [Lithospermum erythrorhizon]|nr:hypothetical protein Leryth_009892 [Lithospermum erythrorhizon]